MSCDEPTKGRYVIIYMSRHELLALAEVEVFGTVVAGNYNPHFRLNLQTSQSHSVFALLVILFIECCLFLGESYGNYTKNTTDLIYPGKWHLMLFIVDDQKSYYSFL